MSKVSYTGTEDPQLLTRANWPKYFITFYHMISSKVEKLFRDNVEAAELHYNFVIE
jgi:hypothetical protein